MSALAVAAVLISCSGRNSSSRFAGGTRLGDACLFAAGDADKDFVGVLVPDLLTAGEHDASSEAATDLSVNGGVITASFFLSLPVSSDRLVIAIVSALSSLFEGRELLLVSSLAAIAGSGGVRHFIREASFLADGDTLLARGVLFLGDAGNSVGCCS